MEYSEEYKTARRAGYVEGYAAARDYYGSQSTRAESILKAWNNSPDSRARRAIELAWPELQRAIENLESLESW